MKSINTICSMFSLNPPLSLQTVDKKKNKFFLPDANVKIYSLHFTSTSNAA